ncbi:MAG: nucleotidyl transferase AbiEii/AbiGii toxin family protein [Rhodospirillaceae bacterium]|nr:nucleotidyl transferase AbiEii/AbiGii toxin family protein [Rhodospirillaceae bacterium]
MASPTVQTLQRLAGETGYQPDTLEKVLRLLDLLDEIAGDPMLSERLVLKGGTALNVFHLDLDRLSVDIDLNYIGALDLTTMESERPHVDAAIDRLLASQGYAVRHRPTEHAGGKWLSRYASALGGNASLELDVNYMARQPLFGATRMESRLFGELQTSRVLVLDLHEIVAGKIVALFDRHAARDLFDMRRILSIEGLNWGWIKVAVLAIGVCNRRDWRMASTDTIACDPREFRQKLAVCLPRGQFAHAEDIDSWLEHTVTLCRERLAFLFDLSPNEQEFLDGVLDRGAVDADLLDVDTGIRARIRAMPMLAWKSRYVRRHHRLDR